MGQPLPLRQDYDASSPRRLLNRFEPDAPLACPCGHL